ncbi:hypothetical protein [Kaarinaea lacus]
MWHRIIKPGLIFLAGIISCPADAKCEINADNLYEQFKNYREHINTATRLEDLTNYFSQNFNLYYSDKLANARGEASKQRYLTQYWDNLNTLKDIVIVFDYSAKCDKGIATLALVSILDTNQSDEGQEVELWNVLIDYTQDNHAWKIDSFEYKKLGSRKDYLATEIKSNFVRIH